MCFIVVKNSIFVYNYFSYCIFSINPYSGRLKQTNVPSKNNYTPVFILGTETFLASRVCTL